MLHLSEQDHTVTDNIITISPCSRFLTVTKKLYYKFIFPPRAVCRQTVGKPHPRLETSNSFSSTMTIAAVTSGIKFEQGDYMAVYYWLNVFYGHHVYVKTKSFLRAKTTPLTDIIDIFVSLGQGVDSYKCQSLRSHHTRD